MGMSVYCLPPPPPEWVLDSCYSSAMWKFLVYAGVEWISHGEWTFLGPWLLTCFGHPQCQLLFLSGFLLFVTCSVSSHHWMPWGLERKMSMCLVVFMPTTSFSPLNGCLWPWLPMCVWLMFHPSELKHPANSHTLPHLQNACQKSQHN